VCSRLGLVSLGYLWLQPQAALLQGMIDADIEAILVKVRPPTPAASVQAVAGCRCPSPVIE